MISFLEACLSRPVPGTRGTGSPELLCYLSDHPPVQLAFVSLGVDADFTWVGAQGPASGLATWSPLSSGTRTRCCCFPQVAHGRGQPASSSWEMPHRCKEGFPAGLENWFSVAVIHLWALHLPSKSLQRPCRRPSELCWLDCGFSSRRCTVHSVLGTATVSYSGPETQSLL